MDTDLMLVIGIILAVLTIPALLSAYSESRVPRAPAIIVMIAGALVVTAISQKPSGYTLHEAAQAFGKVAHRLMD